MLEEKTWKHIYRYSPGLFGTWFHCHVLTYKSESWRFWKSNSKNALKHKFFHFIFRKRSFYEIFKNSILLKNTMRSRTWEGVCYINDVPEQFNLGCFWFTLKSLVASVLELSLDNIFQTTRWSTLHAITDDPFQSSHRENN